MGHLKRKAKDWREYLFRSEKRKRESQKRQKRYLKQGGDPRRVSN